MAWRHRFLFPRRGRTAASSPRNDLVKNCRMHPTHWLISTQVHPLASIRDWAAVLRGGCLQAPGDVLYVPRGWTHATLNVGEALAVGEQAQWPAADRLRRARAVLARAPDDVRALHSFGVAAAGAEINQ